MFDMSAVLYLIIVITWSFPGPALLVRPVTDQGAVSANVYFPGADEVSAPWSLPFTHRGKASQRGRIADISKAGCMLFKACCQG